MSPVQYQIQTDPSPRKPPTTHYAMADRKETYAFSKSAVCHLWCREKLYRGSGTLWGDIAGTNNSTYNELLPAHGYIVSRDFTAFVCYDETGKLSAIRWRYGKDMGKKAELFQEPIAEIRFICQKTENSCYIHWRQIVHSVMSITARLKAAWFKNLEAAVW